ncbi:MAG: cytochrome P450, partial [Moorea sp. SIO4A3]|nr:cytochrome P450 [Moorena sp. SIO4A3]
GYLEACLLETGRLFPPVTRTFHITTAADTFNNTRIPPDMEILHFFPIMQRERSLDPSTDSFVPQRWLDRSDQDNSTYSNLFLRGSRTCPGRDLILFVCKSAIAILLDQQQLTSKTNELSRDPLPAYFPENDIQFVNP